MNTEISSALVGQITLARGFGAVRPDRKDRLCLSAE